MDFESQIEKIVKDIRDREDKELALAFTNVIGSLLRENGVAVKTSRHEFVTDNETDKNKYIIKKEYGISIDGLDFTEHDKKFNDEIERLKKRIGKLASIRVRCHESARDSFDLGNYGSLHIVTADELKTTKDKNDRTVELPFDALETANMLINAEYSRQTSSVEKAFTGCNVEKGHIYSVDDLEQIAEYLLVYCKHNKESEE